MLHIDFLISLIKLFQFYQNPVVFMNDFAAVEVLGH